MKKINYIYIIYLFWLVPVVTLTINGNITFGHGLGDLYYLIAILFFTIISFFLYVRLKRKKILSKKNVYYFFLYNVFVVILFSLKLTIYRGSEYLWNGHLFLNYLIK